MMMRKFKKIIKRLLGKKQVAAIIPDPEGREFYNPNSEMTFQSYFDENKEMIFRGEVPTRYLKIAKMVPGDRVMEIGSADGTQSLVLAEQKKSVYGLELMPQQFQISNELKSEWLKLGKEVENCNFYNGDAASKFELLSQVDTVFMSRVIYHLRDGIVPLLKKIEESTNIKNLMLVGCPNRERRWLEHGDTGDALGKYAYYASQKGMEKLAIESGFKIISSFSSTSESDPIVIAERE